MFDKIVEHKDIDKIIIRKNLLAMSPKVVNFILNLTNNFGLMHFRLAGHGTVRCPNPDLINYTMERRT